MKKLASQLFPRKNRNESIMLTSGFFGFFTDRNGPLGFWTFIRNVPNRVLNFKPGKVVFQIFSFFKILGIYNLCISKL
jgi:hypothetical protein